MKKIYLTLCLVAVTFGSLLAGPVDQQKAQKLGAKFLSTTALAQRNNDIQLHLVSAALNMQRGGIDYYIFNVTGGEGFVIVAGDDRVKPILAYSTEGEYNPQDVADGLAYTLAGFQEEIQYVRRHNLEVTPDIVAEWKSVSESGQIVPGRKARAVVDQLCHTLWNQNYPWNSQCPEDEEGNGGHVYAGCVATAMGQVMKFWDWPAQGTGSHTYNPSGYAQQSANFGETEYHFELMPNELDSTSTEEQIFYVAQLLHHIGISVDMQYSGHGSGAYSESVPAALHNYFRYSSDDHITNYGSYWPGWGYTNEEWIQMLKDGGLDEGLPLYYSGSDDGGAGGHAFVCDGYDENDYFHFNWGWSGRDNVWAPVGALNTTRYAFNQMNGFTGHIRPQSDEYFLRPEKVDNFVASENDKFDGVNLSWVNPVSDLNGQDLTEITSVTILRNFEEVAVLTDAQPGAAMDYEDNDLVPGLYEYEIFVSNAEGASRSDYVTMLVGQKCDVTFVLHDQGGNGWKGAAISVVDANDNRIAVVTMTEGSDDTLTMPLLHGDLDFRWNHGWYHSYEEYDTDGECSFSILDSDGNVLYTSAELEDGTFFTFNNDCDPTAVPETTIENDIDVYPNPTTGLVYVEGQGTMHITVSNVLGQQLMQTTAEGNTSLDLSRYGQGMYLVRIESANGVTMQKVNVKK
ncbi:MAG: thiol protease/hemagglutinin PrtT [Bacteroidales bacterium]|nr:thiol protease/hemagglutinin PrtT [Bacteroidales bacterium]